MDTQKRGAAKAQDSGKVGTITREGEGGGRNDGGVTEASALMRRL